MTWNNDIINLDEATTRVLGHRDMYIRWLKAFFAADTLSDLTGAFQNRDFDAAHKAAHKLKGTAANLAITKLAAQVSSIDEKLKVHTPFNELIDEFDILDDYYNEAREMFIENIAELEKMA